MAKHPVRAPKAPKSTTKGKGRGRSRGPGPKPRKPVSRKRAAVVRRYYQFLQRLAEGESYTRAAQHARISRRAITRLQKERGGLARSIETGRYFVSVDRTFAVFATDNKSYFDVPFDRANASVMGKYWNAVKAAMNSGDPRLLRPFRKAAVHDLNGRRYKLLTDLNEIFARFDSMTEDQLESFEEKFYRRVRDAA